MDKKGRVNGFGCFWGRIIGVQGLGRTRMVGLRVDNGLLSVRMVHPFGGDAIGRPTNHNLFLFSPPPPPPPPPNFLIPRSLCSDHSPSTSTQLHYCLTIPSPAYGSHLLPQTDHPFHFLHFLEHPFHSIYSQIFNPFYLLFSFFCFVLFLLIYIFFCYSFYFGLVAYAWREGGKMFCE